MNPPGNLYIIPSAIDETHPIVLLPDYLDTLSGLHYFMVENIRSARRFIKKVLPAFDINACVFWEFDKHLTDQLIEEPIQLLLSGKSVGLLSEAGCPGIADPGSILVKAAHQHKIRVVPWIGPSSILMALMASGMNGQAFVFHGYLPASKSDLSVKLKQLESESIKSRATQIFIETPYRNQSLMESLLKELKDTTSLCLAINLTGSDEFVIRHTIRDWKKIEPPSIHKKTAIFLIEA